MTDGPSLPPAGSTPPTPPPNDGDRVSDSSDLESIAANAINANSGERGQDYSTEAPNAGNFARQLAEIVDLDAGFGSTPDIERLTREAIRLGDGLTASILENASSALRSISSSFLEAYARDNETLERAFNNMGIAMNQTGLRIYSGQSADRTITRDVALRSSLPEYLITSARTIIAKHPENFQVLLRESASALRFRLPQTRDEIKDGGGLDNFYRAAYQNPKSAAELLLWGQPILGFIQGQLLYGNEAPSVYRNGSAKRSDSEIRELSESIHSRFTTILDPQRSAPVSQIKEELSHIRKEARRENLDPQILDTLFDCALLRSIILTKDSSNIEIASLSETFNFLDGAIRGGHDPNSPLNADISRWEEIVGRVDTIFNNEAARLVQAPGNNSTPYVSGWQGVTPNEHRERISLLHPPLARSTDASGPDNSDIVQTEKDPALSDPEDEFDELIDGF